MQLWPFILGHVAEAVGLRGPGRGVLCPPNQEWERQPLSSGCNILGGLAPEPAVKALLLSSRWVLGAGLDWVC